MRVGFWGFRVGFWGLRVGFGVLGLVLGVLGLVFGVLGLVLGFWGLSCTTQGPHTTALAYHWFGINSTLCLEVHVTHMGIGLNSL